MDVAACKTTVAMLGFKQSKAATFVGWLPIRVSAGMGLSMYQGAKCDFMYYGTKVPLRLDQNQLASMVEGLLGFSRSSRSE